MDYGDKRAPVRARSSLGREDRQEGGKLPHLQVVGAQAGENLAKRHLSQRTSRVDQTAGGRERAGRREIDPPRAPASLHTRALFVAPSGLKRISDSNVLTTYYLEFPSQKGYQIGRELQRTLTWRFREGLGMGRGGGGGIGAPFL